MPFSPYWGRISRKSNPIQYSILGLTVPFWEKKHTLDVSASSVGFDFSVEEAGQVKSFENSSMSSVSLIGCKTKRENRYIVINLKTDKNDSNNSNST